MKGLRAALPARHAGSRRNFTWGHIGFRAAWALAWLVFAAWTPPPLHGWRRLLLRLAGARLGAGARVYGSARIWYPPHLAMGAGAVLGPHVVCTTMAPVTIGRLATVSQYAHLVTGTHRLDDPDFGLSAAPIVLGDHVWIASGALVGPGVTVGEGAVLGARGVAFRDLAPWTVHVGNPARPVRPRPRFAR
ncbi:putative colanic acid biosynthesis acetyltransferase [Prosthecomicrobium pneumaticum]|uniref:Putative colanic acid biosynthesis acetyltransferase WcaF n=1 Tax=Prosthecomicrobium pneumaticum TaxID=81895 RepID=A0A7W9CVF7_9HYPH|nr:putative colanic acid biosynthesis acetyltransferase [Prosthecomicrobium pneumaticum]MBB5752655.1 putative colanic acid biosynthesis acetyltransferase WcaF [Prosthecomicrobium pneumaticum]